MIQHPNIDPIAFYILSMPIKWYGLAYFFGAFIGYGYAIYLVQTYRFFTLTRKNLEDLLNYVVLGVIIGGRLGYVIFYDLVYHLHHPHHILYTWRGGMSFHGALIGVGVALGIYCMRQRVSFWRVGDLLACVVPIGLFLGRIANFINQEHYGRITNSKWGMFFPKVDFFYRHPSQLYEALGEGIILFLVCNGLCFFLPYKPGRIMATFFIFYGFFRFVIEYVRVPDGFLCFYSTCLTTGQALSLPMIVLGSIALYWSFKSFSYVPGPKR